MKVCGYLDKGKSSIKAFYEKNSFLMGETAQICCEIDNSTSSLNI